MSRLYLITGFLGAGKTTLLRRFVSFFQGDKIRFIINEFGREGIDANLLSDIQAVMQEISGGSVFCACRLDQFEDALQLAGKDETILVEASGLSDPTGVRRLFARTDRFPHITYMGAVCLADAVRFPKVYKTARTCVRQIAASDIVVLNKTDLATENQIEETEKLIRSQRPDMKIIRTSFGVLPDDFLSLLAQSSKGDTENLPFIADLFPRRMTVKLSKEITSYELEMFIRMFAENTYRVKGLIETKDRGLVAADCVENLVSVKDFDGQAEEEKIGVLTILSGGNMSLYSSVKAACQWYEEFIEYRSKLE